MAFWSKKEPDFEAMAAALEEQPGMSARQLAENLGVAPSTVTRRLPGMEEVGILLYEDDQGHLWPFKQKS